MSMVALRAHFDGRALILDEPLNLPAGQRVLVQIEPITSTPIVGVPGSSLERFAGILSDEEAKELTDAIEEGSGRVDPDAW